MGLLSETRRNRHQPKTETTHTHTHTHTLKYTCVWSHSLQQERLPRQSREEAAGLLQILKERSSRNPSKKNIAIASVLRLQRTKSLRETNRQRLLGACTMTTKLLDNKICTFKIILSWRFARKQCFWTIFLSVPNASPSEFFFFVVCVCVCVCCVVCRHGGLSKGPAGSFALEHAQKKRGERRETRILKFRHLRCHTQLWLAPLACTKFLGNPAP